MHQFLSDVTSFAIGFIAGWVVGVATCAYLMELARDRHRRNGLR